MRYDDFALAMVRVKNPPSELGETPVVKTTLSLMRLAYSLTSWVAVVVSTLYGGSVSI